MVDEIEIIEYNFNLPEFQICLPASLSTSLAQVQPCTLRSREAPSGSQKDRELGGEKMASAAQQTDPTMRRKSVGDTSIYTWILVREADDTCVYLR